MRVAIALGAAILALGLLVGQTAVGGAAHSPTLPAQPVATQETKATANGGVPNPSQQDSPAKIVKNSPVYVEAHCDHGCGYSDYDPGFLHRLTSDPVSTFTAVLAVVTFFLFVVAIVQIRFLISADRVARKSIEIAERTLVVSQRPIVWIERFDNFASVDEVGAVVRWTFRAYIKNTGNTEAINMHNHINLVIITSDLPDDFDYHDVKSARPPSLGVLSAKQENEFQSFNIEIQHAISVFENRQHIFFYGWVEYDDIFEGSSRHRTEFAFKVTFLGDPRVIGLTQAMRFDPFGQRYNHIDRGCLYRPGQQLPQEDATL